MPYFLAYMSKKEFWICSIEISVVCCLVCYRRAFTTWPWFPFSAFCKTREGQSRINAKCEYYRKGGYMTDNPV